MNPKLYSHGYWSLGRLVGWSRPGTEPEFAKKKNGHNGNTTHNDASETHQLRSRGFPYGCFKRFAQQQPRFSCNETARQYLLETLVLQAQTLGNFLPRSGQRMSTVMRQGPKEWNLWKEVFFCEQDLWDCPFPNSLDISINSMISFKIPKIYSEYVRLNFGRSFSTKHAEFWQKHTETPMCWAPRVVGHLFEGRYFAHISATSSLQGRQKVHFVQKRSLQLPNQKHTFTILCLSMPSIFVDSMFGFNSPPSILWCSFYWHLSSPLPVFLRSPSAVLLALPPLSSFAEPTCRGSFCARTKWRRTSNERLKLSKPHENACNHWTNYSAYSYRAYSYQSIMDHGGYFTHPVDKSKYILQIFGISATSYVSSWAHALGSNFQAKITWLRTISCFFSNNYSGNITQAIPGVTPKPKHCRQRDTAGSFAGRIFSSFTSFTCQD